MIHTILELDIFSNLGRTLEILTVLGVSGIIVAIINKRKSRRDKQQQEVDIFDKVRKSLSEEINRLETRVTFNNKRIEQLEEEAQKIAAKTEEERERMQLELDKLKRQNKEYQYRLEVKQLAILQLQKAMNASNWQKSEVFILDDDETVLEQFAERFSRIVTLQARLFTDPHEFLMYVHQVKPPVVVIDYRLDNMTADRVIEAIEYEPEIFIMSGVKEFQARFAGRRVQFFEKRDYYVLDIAKAIIKHLTEKE